MERGERVAVMEGTCSWVVAVSGIELLGLGTACWRGDGVLKRGGGGGEITGGELTGVAE